MNICLRKNKTITGVSLMKNKHIMLSILAAMLVMALSACATHQNFVKKHNAWVGKDISSFIDTIGHPDKIYTLPTKNTVYVYRESRIRSSPGMMMGPWGWGGGMMGGGWGGGRMMGGPWGWGGGMMGGPWGGWGGGMMMGNDIQQQTCKLFLEVNKKHKIVRWSSRGNNCVSSSPSP